MVKFDYAVYISKEIRWRVKVSPSKKFTGRSSFPLNSTQFPWQLFKSLYAQLRGQLWEHKAHKGTIVCESLPASVNLGQCLELQDHLL